MRLMSPSLLVGFTLFLTPQDPQQPPRTQLAQDGTVGVVLDRQGTALVRPVGRERWTPLHDRARLQPGDQVRTEARGANAVEVELVGGGSFILGPGSLVELTTNSALRLNKGEVEVKGGVHAVKLSGPGFERAIDKALVLRSDGQKSTELKQAPAWLLGYRSSTTDEWMGSLIAQVDGRDVALNVGYHKVTVEVHDQIARTTIEESFVNTTNSTLEGQFFFPLPGDASISGFGMWIGDELVEADIVEKQRARAIYEDILRNRKDPGLLEWSGGNMFKARVFPIWAHSEKRIRISYTQVLPLEGTQVRYRYALRSEMLRKHPLRELSIQVVASSTVPIEKVECKSHEARVRKTGNSASVEFTASEFAPDRDFEVQIGLGRTQGLTVVPHRRGADGYFMLLLSPPGADGVLQRQLVPEGAPLDLLLIADTSGSMDQAARSAQQSFLTALLGCLGQKDRFRLMTCDVTARWLREEEMAADEKGVQAAMQFVEQRPSLGWTDLELAVGQAMASAKAGTTVVYVGDGIATNGAGDDGLAQRLRERAKGSTCTFHAVVTGPTHDRTVLEALASIGGGSVRAADSDPAECARALLAEVAQPAVKDLAVAFEGIATARVYPERLPNLAADAQQVVLGRFLPAGVDGEAQRGTVVVTGVLNGKPVRYTAELLLNAGDEGNSFVPRLWARRHIDALLDQGRSKEIQEQIVACSEEFGIMTPFTSFLVLENDADRERYGVQRRVKMRDGEQFFADARARATAELMRQQMELARTWRVDLRRRMLRELATLGRHVQAIALGSGAREGQYGQIGGARLMPISRAAASEWKDGAEFREQGDDQELGDRELGDQTLDVPAKNAELDAEEYGPPAEAEPSDKPAALDQGKRQVRLEMNERAASGKAMRNRYDWDSLDELNAANWHFARDQRGNYVPQPANYLFPNLPPPKAPQADVPPPDWPAEVLAEIAQLYRQEVLSGLTTGLRLVQRGGYVHPLRGHATSWDRAEGGIGPDGWFVRGMGRSQQTTLQYVLGGKRGIVAVGVRLGRERAAVPADRAEVAFPFRDLSLTDLVRGYASYRAKVEQSDAELMVVTLTAPEPQQYAFRLKIDRRRHVVLESEGLYQGKTSGKTRFQQFVQAAGMWWPTHITTLDGEQRVIGRHELELTECTADEAKGLVAAAARTDDVIMLGAEDPAIDAAKQAAFEGRAGFAEHFAIAMHFAQSQQWDRVSEAWQAAEQAVAGKPGAAWVRALFFAYGRKQQELKELLGQLAPALAARKDGDVVWLAQHLLGTASNALAPNEMLALLDSLEGAFGSGDDVPWQRVTWQRLRATWLQAAGRAPEALELHRQILALQPFEIDAVTAYVDALWRNNERKAAIRCAEENFGGKWADHELTQLYERATNFLWETRELAKLKTVLEAWLQLCPAQEGPWQRWLSTLLFLDQQAEADAWVAATFATELTETLDVAPRARIGAAISYCLGQGWNFSAQNVDERWLRPLADLARGLLKVEDAGWYLSQRILSDWRFLQSDAAARLRGQLAADLAQPEAVEAMAFDRLGRYLAVITWDRAQVDQQLWRTTVDRLKARWTKAADNDRATLAGLVLRLLDAHLEPQEAIAFTRSWLAAANAEQAPEVARQLMRRLVQQDWTEALEDELVTLLPRLQPVTAEALQRKAIGAGAARWLTDRLLRMRIAALMGPEQDSEQLPRAELRQKQATAKKTARTALAARLPKLRAAAGEWTQRPLELERLCLLAEASEQLQQVDGEVRELLVAFPEPLDAMDTVLRERCAFVVAYCATRRQASAGLADGAVALLRGMAAAPAAAEPGYATDWRYHLYRLLIALDRPDALMATLREWIQPEKGESRWRLGYGWLLAETGKLAEAAKAFEAVAASDELGAREYEAMAQWYLVLGRNTERETAQLARYRVMPEHELSNLISQAAYAMQSRGNGMPASLDPDIMRAIQALLHKASYPANHLGSVQRLYEQCKDFRLLESLADGVLGHTAEAIYPFLQQVSGVTSAIHEEATCDRLAARIAELQAAAKTDVDRRALLLLTMMVERRAAEVLNQPGPHTGTAVRAMQAAFRQGWLPGERLLMAGLLGSLGRLPQPELAAEQMRQLKALHELAPAGTLERLQIALYLDQARWSYGQHDQALDHLIAALDELRALCDGKLAADANDALQTVTGWLEHRKHFARGETLLRSELAAQPGQQAWLSQRLFILYVRCLENGGSTALGSGASLYEKVRLELEQFLFRAGESQLREGITTLCNLHRAAMRAHVASAGEDLQAFARQRMPELLTCQPSEVWSVVSTVAQTIVELSGPRPGLQLLIERLEAEPAFYARLGQDGWNSLASMLAEWRVKTDRLGDLEPRLLRIVLRELERDLRSMQHRNRSIYASVRSGHFWTEKFAEFAAVAERVIEQSQDSPARLLHVADYLWNDLELKERAIAVMTAAIEREQIRDDGRCRLVSWLHSLCRFEQSLPVIAPLLADHPENLDYRVLQVRALHGVKRDREAEAFVADTEKLFRATGRWTEQALNTLAHLSLQCGYHARSIVLFEELIPLHQRTQPNRGVGNGTLSYYYQALAQARVATGQVDEAVDAAASAIVAWGRDQDNRRSALEALLSVVRQVAELDALVARHDSKVASSGNDAPVLRKAFAAVYAERKLAQKALPQLLAARALQADDPEIHAALVAAYDKLGRPREACAALLVAIATTPMSLDSLDLSQNLGRRLRQLGDVEGAERAFTNLVEVQPEEAESHRRLARQREEQQRFADAVTQWQHVVRIRTDEPEGWLGLAGAQDRAGDRDGARRTLQQVIKTKWAERFGDVEQQAMQLLTPLSRPPR